MKDNVLASGVVFIAVILLLWVMVHIANSGPKYKCVDGIVYENYMSDDVWLKTKRECLDIK